MTGNELIISINEQLASIFGNFGAYKECNEDGMNVTEIIMKSYVIKSINRSFNESDTRV